MILRVTLTYFDGRHADQQNHRDLTREEARKRQEWITDEIRKAIQGNVLLTLSGDTGVVAFAYPPGLLNQTHIKFEIIEE